MDEKPEHHPEESQATPEPDATTQPSSEELDREVLADLQRRSRRGFLVSGVAALVGLGLWRWFVNQPQVDGLLAPLRKSLAFNERISRTLFRPDALAPEFATSRAVADFRRNGDIGLSNIHLNDWRLELVGAASPAKYRQYTPDVMSWTYGQDDDTSSLLPQQRKPATHEQDAKGAAVTMKPMEMPEKAKGVPGLLLTMEDIRALPKTTMVTEFKCIEGWSEIVHWSGARLRDFLIAYPPITNSGAPFDPTNRPKDMPEYVGLETPDGEYYVGIEREVALHPQTLLAYEINDAPLSMAHGAPLRLVTPLKYGIKQLKQIGRITYSDPRPPDYWAEQGYDYYSGH